jgi:hypothetical protein
MILPHCLNVNEMKISCYLHLDVIIVASRWIHHIFTIKFYTTCPKASRHYNKSHVTFTIESNHLHLSKLIINMQVAHCEIGLKGWFQEVIMLKTQMLQELKKEGLYVFISLMMVGNKHNENQVATKQKT